MKKLYSSILVAGLIISLGTSLKANETSKEDITQALELAPSVLRKNLGQWDDNILYRTAVNGATVSFLKNGISYGFIRERENPEGTPMEFKPHFENTEAFVWNMEFLGINKDYTMGQVGKTDSRTNYFLGNDPSRHAVNVPDYSMITYQGLYNNINLRYYLNKGKLKYDYILKPEGDVSDIKMRAVGIEGLEINRAGELEITTPWGVLLEKTPFSYQIVNGVLKEVDIRYELYDDRTFGFKIHGEYDPDQEIIVDPIVLDWGTYIGVTDVSARSYSFDATKDKQGNIYVTGKIQTIITTPGAYDGTFNGGVNDVFVCKISADGKQMLYATYVGGGTTDWGHGIAVDDNGNAYVTGLTASGDFPMVSPFQSALVGGDDAFLFKLNSAGNALVFSTYFGGGGIDWPGGHIEDEAISSTIFPDSNFKMGNCITLNKSNEAIITGMTSSSDFPYKTGNLSGAASAFLVKFNATGTNTIHSELFGGTGTDIGRGVTMNQAGDVLIVGHTNSVNFPKTTSATAKGDHDVYVRKYQDNPGSPLAPVYSTLVGGSKRDAGIGIATNTAGDAFVSGFTQSTDFGTIGSLQGTSINPTDAFVMRLNSSGTMMYCTYVGGTFVNEISTDIGVTSKDEAFITGYTESKDFPLICEFDGQQQTDEGFLTKVDPSGNIVFSSYVGGSSMDYGLPRLILHEDGCDLGITISITTHSDETTFPVSTDSYYPKKLNHDNGVHRDHPAVVTLKSDFDPDFESALSCGSTTVQFKDLTSQANQGCVWGNTWKPSTWTWQFGDGQTSTEENPSHTYAAPGTYSVSLTVSCPVKTISKQVNVTSGGSPINATASTNDASCGQSNGSATVSASGGGGTFTYKWDNGQTTQTISGLAPGTYSVTIKDQNGCSTTTSATVKDSGSLNATAVGSDASCGGSDGFANVNVSGGVGSYQYSWSNGATTRTITGLAPGTYTVNVTSGGCTASATVEIKGSGGIDAPTAADYGDGCDRQGGVNASATVNPTGGSSPYTYQWDDPGNQTTQTATGLAAGTYNVSVKDASGCKATGQVVIEERIQISTQIKAHASCNGCKDGEVEATIGGFGTPPYTYRWDDENQQTTLKATGLKNGTYTITITDNNDCRNTATITIGVTGISENNELNNKVTIYPNPGNGLFMVKAEGLDLNSSTVFVRDLRGRIIYKKRGELFDGTVNLTGHPEGIYFMELKSEDYFIVKKIHLLK